MKKLMLAFCVAALIAPALRAQDTTPEDLAKAVQYLEKTRDGVVAATKGLSEAQWKFKPGTNRWSVAEVTEHIAAAEDFLMDMVRDQVMKAPPRDKPADLKALDELVLQKVPDRSVKAQAPEPLQPKNRYGNPKMSLRHFRDSRMRTIRFLNMTKGLRQHAADSPFGQKLDAYEWILFVAAHSERHTKQIEEVKADPKFPKQ